MQSIDYFTIIIVVSAVALSVKRIGFRVTAAARGKFREINS